MFGQEWVRAMACKGKLEDNVWELALPSHHGVPEIELRSPGLAVSAFTCCATSLVLWFLKRYLPSRCLSSMLLCAGTLGLVGIDSLAFKH